MKKIYPYSIVAILVVAGCIINVPVSVSAQEKCSFTEEYLEVGSVSENVRCLQRFLNSSGFIISDSGAGSPGKETDTFKEKTREALIKWQIAKGITPATGYFGPTSRRTYENQVNAATSMAAAVITPSTTTVVPLVQTPAPEPVVTPPKVSNENSTETKLKNNLKKLRQDLNNAEEDIEDAADDGEDVQNSEERLKKARDRFLDAVYAYFDEDYTEAQSFYEKSKKYLEDAVEDIKGDSEDAQDAIQDARKALNKAREAIGEAEDDDEDTEDAQDKYEQAKDKYDEAREEYDDDNFEDAEKLAKQAEDLADDAVDAL